jgi:GNAT superfamily N-acetyltransferase
MRHVPERPLPERRYLPGGGERPQLELGEPAPLTRAGWRDHLGLGHGIDLFNHGFPWEAHEVWEASWQLTPEGPERELLRGLIQEAAAACQRALGKGDGAERLARRSRDHLDQAAGHGPIVCGIELAAPVSGEGTIRWHRRSRDLPGTFTDQVVQPPECTFEAGPDFLLRRAPGHPEYYFGRMLVADRPVTAETLAAWRGRADRELRGDGPGFFNLGWETEERGPAALGELEAGLELERFSVLWADTIEVPPPPRGLEVRPVESDRDWERAAALAADISVASWGEGAREFTRWRFRGHREVIRLRGGALLAAWIGDEMAGICGLIDAGRYLRYQEVNTAASHRRRGVASHLIAAVLALVQGGRRRRAVIVAEPDAGPERLYLALGFTPVTTQHGLRWVTRE